MKKLKQLIFFIITNPIHSSNQKLKKKIYGN